MTSLPLLLTTSEVADWLKVDRQTVRRWAHSGQLKVAKLPGGREMRFAREDIEALISSARPESAAS